MRIQIADSPVLSSDGAVVAVVHSLRITFDSIEAMWSHINYRWDESRAVSFPIKKPFSSG